MNGNKVLSENANQNLSHQENHHNHHHHHSNHGCFNHKSEHDTESSSSSSAASSDEFNPNVLHESFKQSLRKSNESLSDYDDVSIKEYLRAYEEINKFLACLGTIFYFVITDVKDKIAILENYLEKNPNEYETILSAIEYEKSNNMLFPPSSHAKHSCARTILRLHRALIFVFKFLDKLFNADPKCRTAHICSETYELTLGKHHSWLVRKAATLGMMALPKREVLMSHMCKNKEDQEVFPNFIRVVEKVYNITQKIYEDNQILDLP